jgi:hypothetical protein
MEPITKQSETMSTKPDSNAGRRIVGVIFAIIEIILGFRFVFKLLSANPDNGFVKVIYNITQWFVGIFNGIFPQAKNSVFEPGTLIAIVVVALLAWIVLKLISTSQGSRVERTEYTSGSQQPRSTTVPPPQPQQQVIVTPPQQPVPPQQAPQPPQSTRPPQDPNNPWNLPNQQDKS